MRIGMIDVDNAGRETKCFPNIPLMKLSAFHKKNGDVVEWYNPLFGGHFDVVYMSKVFSFTPDYEWNIDADVVIKGGSGYAIQTKNGKETFIQGKDSTLSEEIEHMHPDYSLYGIRDTAYGFLTRGCPRGCAFCHVAAKEGYKSIKVANLSEFWNGERFVKLLDANILACADRFDLMRQLSESGAWIDFTQGLDIRLMNDAEIEAIKQIKVKMIHFAWDNPKDDLSGRFEHFKRVSGINDYRKLVVYVLVNFNSTMDEDLKRVYTLKDLGYSPYIMVYNKQGASRELKRLQRWTNNNIIFRSTKRFEEYDTRRG